MVRSFNRPAITTIGMESAMIKAEPIPTKDKAYMDATASLPYNSPSTPSFKKNIKQSACNAYTWDNKVINQSGTYQNQSTESGGCDSITTLDLTIHTSNNSTTNIRAAIRIPGMEIAIPTAERILSKLRMQKVAIGTATLNLQIDKSSNAFQLVTSCDSLLWNGTIYTTSGTYTYSTKIVWAVTVL